MDSVQCASGGSMPAALVAPPGDVPRGGQLCWEATVSSWMVHERVLRQGRRRPLRVIKCQPCIASTATGPGRSPTSQGAAKHFPSFLAHPPAVQTVSTKTTSRARNPPCPQAILYQACIDAGSYQGLISPIRIKRLRRNDTNIKCPAPHRRCCTRRALMRASRCCPSATGPPSRPSIRQAQSTICIELQLLATLLS